MIRHEIIVTNLLNWRLLMEDFKLSLFNTIIAIISALFPIFMFVSSKAIDMKKSLVKKLYKTKLCWILEYCLVSFLLLFIFLGIHIANIHEVILVIFSLVFFVIFILLIIFMNLPERCKIRNILKNNWLFKLKEIVFFVFISITDNSFALLLANMLYSNKNSIENQYKVAIIIVMSLLLFIYLRLIYLTINQFYKPNVIVKVTYNNYKSVLNCTDVVEHKEFYILTLQWQNNKKIHRHLIRLDKKNVNEIIIKVTE